MAIFSKPFSAYSLPALSLDSEEGWGVLFWVLFADFVLSKKKIICDYYWQGYFHFIKGLERRKCIVQEKQIHDTGPHHSSPPPQTPAACPCATTCTSFPMKRPLQVAFLKDGHDCISHPISFLEPYCSLMEMWNLIPLLLSLDRFVAHL